MFLVGQKDVFEQWALTGKESASHLKTLGVPVLTLELPFLLNFWLQILAAGVQQKTHLCRHAEV
jgi:hypothetical protein